jgi:hypothetical protein
LVQLARLDQLVPLGLRVQPEQLVLKEQLGRRVLRGRLVTMEMKGELAELAQPALLDILVG